MANKMVTVISLAPYLSAARKGERTDCLLISGGASTLWPFRVLWCHALICPGPTNDRGGLQAPSKAGGRTERTRITPTVPCGQPPSPPAQAPQHVLMLLNLWHCHMCRSWAQVAPFCPTPSQGKGWVGSQWWKTEGRRRKELTGGRKKESCLVQKLGAVWSRSTFNSTGTHSSSVPRARDPHLFDLVWSMDVLLHKGTGKSPRQCCVGMETQPARTDVRVSSRQ